VALFALAGLIFGSFVTALVHRLPRGESMGGRSRCPRCGAHIRAVDNIPLVSFVLLRGRCRICGEPISPEYPLTEFGTAALFSLAPAVHESTFVAALVAPFMGVMLAVGLIDARWRIVPNGLVYPSLGVATVAIVTGHLGGAGVDAVRGLVGLAAYAGPLFLVALVVPHGMGMGDVKLAALIGLVLGSLGLSYVGVAAGVGVIGGGVGALIALTVLGIGRKQQIPFGPFLAGGAVVATLLAPRISDLYLSLLGVR